ILDFGVSHVRICAELRAPREMAAPGQRVRAGLGWPPAPQLGQATPSTLSIPVQEIYLSEKLGELTFVNLSDVKVGGFFIHTGSPAIGHVFSYDWAIRSPGNSCSVTIARRSTQSAISGDKWRCFSR